MPDPGMRSKHVSTLPRAPGTTRTKLLDDRFGAVLDKMSWVPVPEVASIAGLWPTEMAHARSSGDGQGKVTISNSLMGGKTKRQAYSGAVHALSVALEGVPPGTGTASTGATPLGVPGSASGAAGSGANSKKASRGVVVTLGDDSVLSPMSALGSIAQGGLGAAGAPGSTAGTGLGVASGSTPPTGFQSPFVLKFWAGLDMAVCIRTVDVAAQLRDPGQHQTRWAGASGGLARLTAFAVTTDAMQVRENKTRKL